MQIVLYGVFCRRGEGTFSYGKFSGTFCKYIDTNMVFLTTFRKILNPLVRNSLAPRTLTRFMHSESGKCLVNNVELYYEKVGQGPKVLLCLPGALGSTRTDFGPQLEQLQESFTVIAFDPRGYGKSIPPNRSFPLDFYHKDADDAFGLMQQLGNVLIFVYH